MSKHLAEIPLNGFKHQTGGVGVSISFEWLEQELRRKLVCKPDELISQVNVTGEGLVFYFSKIKE